MSDKKTARRGEPSGGEQGRGNVLPHYTLINWYRSIDWRDTIRQFPRRLPRFIRHQWWEFRMRDVRRDEELNGPPDCFPPTQPNLWQDAAHAEGATYWWDIRTYDEFREWLGSSNE